MVLGIYGAGGLGREVMELAHIINKKDNRWDEIFFIDDESEMIVNGAVVYSYAKAIERYGEGIEVAVGIGEPIVRKKIFEKLENNNIKIATLIHPDIYVPETTRIGKGVIIQLGCFVSCNVIIEDHVLIQSQVNIGHNDVLKKGCVVSGLCNLAGNVTVGEYSYLGISSCYREGITIGKNSIIGMGSVVLENIPDAMVAYGNPAKEIRVNVEGKVFK